VLSQKPFVEDLDEGEKLVALAEERGAKLAVHQNGRWAPHFSYMREAVLMGLIGQTVAVHAAVHWDHDWTFNTPFNQVRHLILFDFGIHWFDIITCLMGENLPRSVYASLTRAPGQRARPGMLAQAAVAFDHGQASAVFDGFTHYGAEDHTVVVGTEGTINSIGPDLNHQTVTVYTGDAYAVPALEGAWFDDGFHGAMSELLCAIEENREPSNSARDNLRSLALCYAACASADQGAPVVPGTVRQLPAGSF
jgi:predicted dehydrogenase